MDPQNRDSSSPADAPRSGVTRRAFIKGVIASGAVASSAAYMEMRKGRPISAFS